nr:uncharacterized protein LOC109157428 [Ipomoea batatas]
MYWVYSTHGQAASNPPSDDDDMGILPDPTVNGGVFSIMDMEARDPIRESEGDRVSLPSGRWPSPRPSSSHDDYIELIRQAVQDMVLAGRRFWMDSSPMEALSSYLAGDDKNTTSFYVMAMGVLKKSTRPSNRELGSKRSTTLLLCRLLSWIGVGPLTLCGSLIIGWLRDTDESQARIVREGEVTFYMEQRHMHELLYAKLCHCFSSFSISGWILPVVLPLQHPFP